MSSGVCAPKGFVAGGGACGIKESGAPDLAIVATEDRTAVAAAGVFTTNRACAAPVQVSREHLADGRAAAVVLSSGNANAATGERGRTDARRMAALVRGERVNPHIMCVCDRVSPCRRTRLVVPFGMADAGGASTGQGERT